MQTCDLPRREETRPCPHTGPTVNACGTFTASDRDRPMSQHDLWPAAVSAKTAQHAPVIRQKCGTKTWLVRKQYAAVVFVFVSERGRFRGGPEPSSISVLPCHARQTTRFSIENPPKPGVFSARFASKGRLVFNPYRRFATPRAVRISAAAGSVWRLDWIYVATIGCKMCCGYCPKQG